MAGYSFIVSGDQVLARDTVYSVLGAQGFTVTQLDAWSARAERGSQVASLVMGAFAGKKGRHLKLMVTCGADQSGNLIINLQQETSGASGGLIGTKQASEAYTEVYEVLRNTYSSAGVLLVSNPIT